eukprot:11345182-Alexandrium_andersonii.AAC.1
MISRHSSTSACVQARRLLAPSGGRPPSAARHASQAGHVTSGGTLTKPVEMARRKGPSKPITSGPWRASLAR